MCSRYYVDDGMLEEIRKTVKLVDRSIHIVSGDIRPSENAPVIDGREPELRLGMMRWGFPKYDGKGLFINARAETVTEKPTFRDSVLRRRCAIPASRFYEWDKAKYKAAFYHPGSTVFYFAGFYRVEPEGPRFVILTTEANESVLPVHDRMPLILDQAQIVEWIYDGRQAPQILRQQSPLMKRG